GREGEGGFPRLARPGVPLEPPHFLAGLHLPHEDGTVHRAAAAGEESPIPRQGHATYDGRQSLESFHFVAGLHVPHAYRPIFAARNHVWTVRCQGDTIDGATVNVQIVEEALVGKFAYHSA